MGAALRWGVAPRRPEPGGRYQLGDLAIDYDLREVRLADRPVELTAKEFDLLRLLSVNAGRALTYDQILRSVWRRVNPAHRYAVRSMMKNLRRKLGDDAASPCCAVIPAAS